jgi:hypothetical protein
MEVAGGRSGGCERVRRWIIQFSLIHNPKTIDEIWAVSSADNEYLAVGK